MELVESVSFVGRPERVREVVLQPAPLLLVERVVGQGADWLEVELDVPTAGPLLRGTPQARLLPGTLLTELAVQAGELLIHALRGPTTAAEGVPVLTRLRRVRFRGMVRPGDQVTARVSLTGRAGPAFELAARARVGSRAVLEAELVFGATTAVARAGA